MFKIINALLLVILFAACSSQESKEKIETNTTNPAEIKENMAKIEPKKEVVQERVIQENTSNEKASLFTLTTLEGKTIKIDETEGGLSFQGHEDKVVLILFFGHRCPPCIAEIPVLTALTNRGLKDLEIIAIEVQGYTKEQLKAFKKRKGINYTLVTYDGSAEFINYISKQANWSGAIPFLIGFDKKSVVKVIHAGGLGAKDFDNIYNTLSKKE